MTTGKIPLNRCYGYRKYEMHVRQNLTISWALIVTGLSLASLLDGNWPIIIVGVFGGIASLYRSHLPKSKPFRLGEYLNQNPVLKWFTVIYLLILAGLSLKYIEELSGLLMNNNPILLVLVIFFPFLMIWVKQDYMLYVNNK